ncbi:hypothetical protein M885DRAFT_260366 [Pelagophyceae sp. CCMP2097]|nr:hypothetical protein M885DRAFT_260366 [Pelagophyceae sp. CCMP2097]
MIHTSLPPGPERGEVTLHVVNETSSVLTLCWVDDEGRLHCHYPVGAGSDALWSDDGSASNAHAESTFAGDAFVCFAADDDDVRDAAALTAACRQGRARLACSYVVADAPGDQVLTISEAPPPRWALWPRAEFAVVVCAGAAADVSAPGSGAPRAYAYARRVVAGFDVDVDVRLDAEPLWKLRELCADVEAAALKLPPGAAAELRRETRFVVHLETRGFRAMCYHAKGGGAWLRANGFDADWLAGCVHIYSLDDYLQDRDLWGAGGALLHELCHARHDGHLDRGHGNAVVARRYRAAVHREKRYDAVHVRGPQGAPRTATERAATATLRRCLTCSAGGAYRVKRRHYACTNAAEFFAELSTAYLEPAAVEYNKWAPYNRSGLVAHDAETAGLLARVWDDGDRLHDDAGPADAAREAPYILRALGRCFAGCLAAPSPVPADYGKTT